MRSTRNLAVAETGSRSITIGRLKLALLAATLGAAPALAQQKGPATTGGPDIVVTGMSLKEAKIVLQRCIEQHCPPDKDIDATLAVAETQFVGGDYKSARETMLKSIGRNKRFGAAYPVPVSDLLRANSRVAAHLGERDSYFSGALDVLGTLKAGLPPTDARILGAQVELGDAFAKTGRLEAGIDMYHKVARKARDLHLPVIEGYALLRVANVYLAASQVRNDVYYYAAQKACDVLIARNDPSLLPFARAATLLRGKLAVKNGDPGAIDRLIASYRAIAGGSARPVLLYAPKIEQPLLSGRETSSGETLSKLATENFEDQWVDISFEIAPDGKVTDAAILRKSAKLDEYWTGPIVTAIAGRRYAPLATDAPPALRVERYSYTSAWTTVTGSRQRVRSPIPQIEMVDLSRETPAQGS